MFSSSLIFYLFDQDVISIKKSDSNLHIIFLYVLLIFLYIVLNLDVVGKRRFVDVTKRPFPGKTKIV